MARHPFHRLPGSRRWLASSLLAFVALPLVGPSAVAQDLDAARAALDFYTTSIVALEGEWVTHLGGKYSPGTLVMEDMTLRQEFSVDLQRNRVRLDELKTWKYSKISPDKEFSVRKLTVFDGHRTQTLLRTEEKGPLPSSIPPDVPHKLHVFNRDTTNIHYFPWIVAGLRTRIGPPLAVLLRDAGVKSEGTESVSGAPCWRFSLPAHQATVWLDPENDFLPRRFVYGAGRAKREIDVHDFQQVVDSRHSEKRAFPAKGHVTSGDDFQDFEISRVTLNPSLPESDFQIPESSLPDGVIIVEEGKPTRYSGDRKDLFQQVEAEVDKLSVTKKKLLGIDKPASATANPVRVPPQQTSWHLPSLISAVSLLLILIGVRKLRRSKRPSA